VLAFLCMIALPLARFLILTRLRVQGCRRAALDPLHEGSGRSRNKALRRWKAWPLPVASVLLLACNSMPQRPAGGTTLERDSPTTIYVARRGWHIDIGFRTSDLLPPLASLSAAFPGARYLFFGFGDRHYLLVAHKNFPGLLGALWPGAGVVLATALEQSPDDAFGAQQVIELTVGAAAAQAAQVFVWNSLVQDQGAAVFYSGGPYGASQYLSAVPRYSATHTCNTWAAEVLGAAGVPVRSHGVWFAWQLWSQTQRIQGPGRRSAPTARSNSNSDVWRRPATIG
jgi:hypothetical protein